MKYYTIHNRTTSSHNHLENIINCIFTLKEVNKMPFDEFIELIQDSSDKFRFSKKELNEWKYTGLNNTDFIKMYILK